METKKDGFNFFYSLHQTSSNCVGISTVVYGSFWGVHCLHLDYHGNGRHFEFFPTPKAATDYGGYSYKGS
jgi:hypothetical protein